jgi:hypothetical protein
MKALRFVRLSAVLFVLIMPNYRIKGLIITETLNVFDSFLYQPSSTQSILRRISVRGRIQCATLCIQNSACETATVNQTNSVCSLFVDFTNVAQLSQHNEIVTFARKGEPCDCHNEYQY